MEEREESRGLVRRIYFNLRIRSMKCHLLHVASTLWAKAYGSFCRFPFFSAHFRRLFRDNVQKAMYSKRGRCARRWIVKSTMWRLYGACNHPLPFISHSVCLARFDFVSTCFPPCHHYILKSYFFVVVGAAVACFTTLCFGCMNLNSNLKFNISFGFITNCKSGRRIQRALQK